AHVLRELRSRGVDALLEADHARVQARHQAGLPVRGGTGDGADREAGRARTLRGRRRGGGRRALLRGRTAAHAHEAAVAADEVAVAPDADPAVLLAALALLLLLLGDDGVGVAHLRGG